MKKILIFSTAYPPFVGGAEVAIKEITDRIKDIEFDMVTLRFDSDLPKVEKIGNVTVHRIGFTTKNPSMNDLVKFPLMLNKYLFPFTAWLKAKKLHKKNKYDGIWAMMAAYAGFGASFFKGSNKDVPYLLTLQEGDPIEYIKKRVRFVYPLFKKIFTRADIIQVISTYLGGFAKEMGFKGEPVLVPNAVNYAHFSHQYPEHEIEEIKKKLGKSDDDIYVITASRLVLKNATDDVIKALKHLPEQVKFIVLGTGPDQEMLESLIKELNLEGRVKLVGQVDHKEMPKYLRASDIFIRPSLSEGFGNSFIEAMAAEIPVIATPVGGIVDFLFDPDKNPDKGPTGLFCQVRDPESIAEKIKRFIEDKDLRERIVGNAKAMVAEKYDWDIIARDMSRVFHDLTSK